MHCKYRAFAWLFSLLLKKRGWGRFCLCLCFLLLIVMGVFIAPSFPILLRGGRLTVLGKRYFIKSCAYSLTYWHLALTVSLLIVIITSYGFTNLSPAKIFNVIFVFIFYLLHCSRIVWQPESDIGFKIIRVAVAKCVGVKFNYL